MTGVQLSHPLLRTLSLKCHIDTDFLTGHGSERRGAVAGCAAPHRGPNCAQAGFGPHPLPEPGPQLRTGRVRALAAPHPVAATGGP